MHKLKKISGFSVTGRLLMAAISVFLMVGFVPHGVAINLPETGQTGCYLT